MLRVGLIGVGSMGTVHAAAWAATPAKLTGVFALDTERAALIAQQYGATQYFDFETLLANVDVIDVCVPTYLHREFVVRAAKAGKQIVCEKPLALTIADGEAMIDAVKKAGVHLMIGHVVRFFPDYKVAKQAVDDGEIGQLGTMRLKRTGFQPNPKTGNWYIDLSKSGGMLMDLMIHDYDYARWVAGEVEKVYAHNVRSAVPDAPGDYALVMLQHTSGAITHIEGAWSYPPPMFITGLEIAGSEGLIEHPTFSSTTINTYWMETEAASGPDVAISSSPLAESPYTTEIKHFHDVITGVSAAPVVTANDALEAVRIALAVIESARTGRPVSIAEVA
jgi:predicted dehydrogenase